MIDTVQITESFLSAPNLSYLESRGWKPLGNRPANDPTAYYLNSAKNKGEPRLTLSKNRNEHWHLRAEVSFGRWLYGSNLYLLDEDELNHALNLLSEFVESNSGIVFDAQNCKVTRVDFTRDVQVGEDAVIPVIGQFASQKIPRYTRTCIDDTTVYFKNAGKEQTKQFLIYSKYHERLANSKDADDQEKAKGLIRLEASLRKSAVRRLAKTLKLPENKAKYILTKQTSEKALEQAEKLLHFNELLTVNNNNAKSLFEICGSTEVYKYIGFLSMRDQFGEDFSKLPFVNTPPKTLKRYLDKCRQAGVLSLE